VDVVHDHAKNREKGPAMTSAETTGQTTEKTRGSSKRPIFMALLAAALLGGAPSPAGADPGDRDDDGPPPDVEKTESPYFFVSGGFEGEDAFPLKSTKVSATVSGVIANVVVTQTYENAGRTPLDARYVFPASTRAAVHGMTIRVGDKQVVARIKEREQARQEFEAAKQAGKTASLLAEERPNVFSMSIANVMPRDRVVVELSYTELLVPTAGVYQFVYPTVVGPRYAGAKTSTASSFAKWIATPILRAGVATPATFDIDVSLAGGMPLGDVASPSHAVRLSWENKAAVRVALANADGGAGNRDFILAYRLTGQAIDSGLLLFEGPTEKFFLMMVQPPAVVAPAAILPREYIFVLDVSGSMEGFPLDTAKQLIRDLIGHLRPTDTFNVVLFSGASRLLAPRSLSASAANIERALAVISRERGGGGTELEGALKMALTLPRTAHVSRTVAVVTDGFIAEEPGAFQLVHEHLNDTNLFAFGIGSSVNRHLIEGLARLGQGEPFVVTHPSQADAVGARFRRTVESPLLSNIHFIASDFDIYDVEPTMLSDLFAERPLVVFGKWKGPRTGRLSITGRTAAGPFRTSIEVAATEPRADNAALPRLWARARIARLSDFAVERDQTAAVREVTNLGLTHSLLTAHTSFIAVLEQVRNTTGVARDVQQPLPLPQDVSELAVGEAFGSGAEPELWMLGGLALAVLGGLAAIGRWKMGRQSVVAR
jgi:Ca-activated chloride channel family protein